MYILFLFLISFIIGLFSYEIIFSTDFRFMFFADIWK